MENSKSIEELKEELKESCRKEANIGKRLPLIGIGFVIIVLCVAFYVGSQFSIETYLMVILGLLLIFGLIFGIIILGSLGNVLKQMELTNRINELVRSEYGLEKLVQSPSIEFMSKGDPEKSLNQLKEIFEKLGFFDVKINQNKKLVEGKKEHMPVLGFRQAIAEIKERDGELKIIVSVMGPISGLNYKLLKEIENALLDNSFAGKQFHQKPAESKLAFKIGLKMAIIMAVIFFGIPILFAILTDPTAKTIDVASATSLEEGNVYFLFSKQSMTFDYSNYLFFYDGKLYVPCRPAYKYCASNALPCQQINTVCTSFDPNSLKVENFDFDELKKAIKVDDSFGKLDTQRMEAWIAKFSENDILRYGIWIDDKTGEEIEEPEGGFITNYLGKTRIDYQTEKYDIFTGSDNEGRGYIEIVERSIKQRELKIVTKKSPSRLIVKDNYLFWKESDGGYNPTYSHYLYVIPQ